MTPAESWMKAASRIRGLQALAELAVRHLNDINERGAEPQDPARLEARAKELRNATRDAADDLDTFAAILRATETT